MRKQAIVKKVVKEGGITKKTSSSPSTVSYDNQSIPTIVVRGREIPLVFIKGKNRDLEWRDLDESGATAVTNDSLEMILFKDQENIVCLLATKSSWKLKKNIPGGMSREWMYNYGIYYIMTDETAEMKMIDFREKEIGSLTRIKTEGTNIRRYVNNASGVDFGTWFPRELNHTVRDEDPSLQILFTVCYGTKRSAYKHQ